MMTMSKIPLAIVLTTLLTTTLARPLRWNANAVISSYRSSHDQETLVQQALSDVELQALSKREVFLYKLTVLLLLHVSVC